MKNLAHKIVLFFVLAMTLSACSHAEMEKTFQNPTSEIKTAVYWYWISGNISKEGVVEDLKAMKRAGINRAFIGDIGQDGLYTERNVKIFSDEWWEILHTALRTASELDIEIGIFNSPGWSQSGGPWVKPDEAMRYLASAEIAVSGPQKLSTQIANPTENFQPVRTIAYPAPEGYHSPEVKIKYSASDNKSIDLKVLPSGVVNQMELSLDKPLDARSLTITMSHRPMNVAAHLDAFVDGEWKRVADFKIDRSNAGLGVGFTPYAPATVSFIKTTTDRFRLTFDPSSQAGGIESIELSAMPRISSYAEKTLAKMCQTPLPYWDHYMWSEEPILDSKAHAINPEKVIDLSDKISADGTISWDVPEGEWIILRTGMAPTGVTNSPATPEATGLEIDKMSSKHVKTHFNAFIGQILERIPEKDRSTFRVVVQDSYETGGQNFTDEMIEQFETEYGYSMIPYLPTYYGYVVGDTEKSNRFLWDIRRFIADRVAYEYVGGLKKVSNAHGLTTWLECYGHWGFPGEFLQYGGQSDEIAGEFWSVGELGDIENRAASSCGHIYGKPVIWAESNTSGGPAYSRTPVDMKQRTDRFFTEGINATLLHLYIEQADTARYPGINAWFGNEFDAHNTWYSHLDLFTTYTKRCNYMLQQGLNMADVAYLIGEDAPKMTGLQSPALPKGYQFDYINAEVLLLNANVAQGNIILPHGTSYKVLVLPPVKTMRPELLEKIQRLVKDGAIVLGEAPTHSLSLKDYPASDARVEKMARELWGEAFDKQGMNTYGKGRVYNGYSLEDIFSQIGLTPDCAIKESEPILFNHRSTMDAEIYFISNQSNQKISFNPTFRVDRTLRPEFWDAVDGSIRALPEFEVADGGITLPVSLDALGSGFIVFRRAGKVAATEKNFPAPAKSIELSEPWRVEFDGKLSSHEPITLLRLEDFSLSDDKGLKYFSGTMTYTTEFECEEFEGRMRLDLGRVESMAKVYVNGIYAGGAWCAPYSVDISQYVNSGKNSLRIEVVNKWVNRIVGDMQLPAEERKISLTANPYNASSAIPASGLIGPVRLEEIK